MKVNITRRNILWRLMAALVAAVSAIFSAPQVRDLRALPRQVRRAYWRKMLQLHGYPAVAAGAASTIVEFAERITKLTLNGTVAQGDLLAHDGTNWVKADADAATYLYAQWIAMEAGVSGDEIQACKKCTLFDDDAPYTADAAYYASGTAGGITATRPATAGDLIQVVGRGVSTKRVALEVLDPKEFELFIPPDVYDTTGEPGLGTTDAGWVGPQMDAAGELVFFKGRLPSGLIGSIAMARVLFNSINASAFDNDVTIVGAYDGAANDQDTGTAITAGDWNEDADNKLLYQNVAACFDTDFYKPGRNFCVKMDPDGITNDANVVGLVIRGWKV